MVVQPSNQTRSRVFPQGLTEQETAINPVAQAPPQETGFLENVGAGFGEMIIAGNVGAGENGLRIEYQAIIDALHQRGELSRTFVSETFPDSHLPFENPYSLPNISEPGHLSREEAITQIWAAIDRQRARDHNFLREIGRDRDDNARIVHQRDVTALRSVRDVQSRASGWGRVGNFVGSMGGTLLDPVNMLGLPGGAGPGRSLLSTVAHGVLENALIEGVTQPLVAQQYRRLGEEYGVGDMLTGTLYAGALGGAVRGAGHIGGRASGAAYDRLMAGVFDAMPENIQRRWADRMQVGDGPDSMLLADALRTTVPPEAWTPDLRSAAHVIEREDEIVSASPFKPSPSGDAAHGDALTAALNLFIRDARLIDPGPMIPRGTAAPRRFASRVDAIVHLGTQLEQQGLIVGENRHVGNRRFTPGVHQTGQAHGEYMIDVNDRTMPPGSPRIEARNPEVRVRFDRLALNAQRQGYRVLWNERIYEPYGEGPGARIPGRNTDSRQHRNHIHFEAPEALASGGARAPGTHFGDRRLSAGIRNNNPGNLVDGEMARSMPGYRGTDGHFAQFDTMEQGVAAQEELLRRRVTQGRSIETLIRGTGQNDGYSPSVLTGGDNPEHLVADYIQYLAQRTGIDPNAPIRGADIPRLAEAMRDREARGWRQYLGPERSPEVERTAAPDTTADEVAVELASRDASQPIPSERESSVFAHPPELRRELFDDPDSWGRAQQAVDADWRGRNGGSEGSGPMRSGALVEIEPGLFQIVERPADRSAADGSTVRETSGEAVPAEPSGFRTAMGSVYRIEPDGTTTRDKVYRPEHGADEQGQQPTSEATFYVTPEQADALSLVQTEGGDRMAIQRLENGSIGVRYLSGKDKGKMERRTVVEPAAGPAVGLIPVETWEKGARVHFGNRIAAVDGAAPGTARRRALLSDTALGSSVDVPAALERFDDPAGEGLRSVSDSIEHDIKVALAESPSLAARQFLVDEVGEVSIESLLDQFQGDRAAAKALRDCL